jgi:hypothetical protein
VKNCLKKIEESVPVWFRSFRGIAEFVVGGKMKSVFYWKIIYCVVVYIQYNTRGWFYCVVHLRVS